MQSTYKVIRDCHEGGGTCDKCSGLKSKLTITQLTGLSESNANRVAFNWRGYNAKVVEETENSLKLVSQPTTLDKISEVCKAVADATTDPKSYILQEHDSTFEYSQDIEIDGEKFKIIVKKM